ncbi:MAG: metal ABC transporter permease, partial [Opitutaceae bacterium]
MNWSEIDTWIVVTGALISMACALPGLFLLLNRQSMLGDAI